MFTYSQKIAHCTMGTMSMTVKNSVCPRLLGVSPLFLFSVCIFVTSVFTFPSDAKTPPRVFPVFIITSFFILSIYLDDLK